MANHASIPSKSPSYPERLAEYERRKNLLRDHEMTPVEYEAAIDALSKELGA